MTWFQTQRNRSSASTGARVSPSKFSPTSPKGGFGSSVYEAGRYLDDRYGYRTESYYRQRLFGNSPADVRWRYDVNKRIIGRPDYKSRVSFSWQPRFPKKSWKQSRKSYSKLQERDLSSKRQFRGRFYNRPDCPRCRQCSCRTNVRNFHRYSYRKYY